MVKEIRVNAAKIEFEDDELAATRTLKQLSDGTYITNRLNSKIITATRDMTAASGDISYTGVGFTPTSIIAFAVIAGTVCFTIGFADSSKAAENLSEYGSNLHLTDNLFFGIYATDGNNSQIASIKSYDANVGLTLTWIKSGSPTGTAQLIFLCFR